MVAAKGSVMLYLPTHHRATIIAHARQEAPAEACGILAGIEGWVRRVYRLPNTAPDPRTRYLADPQEQLRAFRDMERRGWEMLAVYHSHPNSPAYPSPTDLSLAYYPQARYVIVSLATGRPEVRCFSMIEGQALEERIG